MTPLKESWTSELIQFTNTSLGHWLAEVLTCSTVLLGITWLLTLLYRNWSAAIRHRVWFLAFCGIGLLPVLLLVLPALRLPVLPPIKPAPVAQVPVAPAAESPSISVSLPMKNAPEFRAASRFSVETSPPSVSSIAQFEKLVEESIQPSVVESDGTFATAVNRTFSTQAIVLLFVIAIGFVSIAGTFFYACLIRKRITAGSCLVDDANWKRLIDDLRTVLAIKSDVMLVRCRPPIVPMTWGILKPVIAIPFESEVWPAARIRAVLLHELAHVKRRDVLTQTIARVVSGMFWFHPLVWVGLRQLRVERELACDDCVIATGEKPSDYAQQLVQIARTHQFQPNSLGIAMAATSKLEHRVMSLLDIARSHVPVSKNHSLALLLGTLVAISATCSLRIGRWTVLEPSAPSAQPFATAVESKILKPGTLRGTVTRPDGSPASKAKIDFYYRWQTMGPSRFYSKHVLTTKTDTDGAFSIPFKAEDIENLNAKFDGPKRNPIIVVEASQTGLASSSFKSYLYSVGDVDGLKIALQLASATVPIEGRIVDLEGNAVAGATIRPRWSISTTEDIDQWYQRAAKNPVTIKREDMIARGGQGNKVIPFPGSAVVNLAIDGRDNVLKTDADGRFRYLTAGDDRKVVFELSAEGFATTRFSAVTRDLKPIPMPTEHTGESQILHGCKFELAVEPERLIKGIIRDKKTGEPIPNVKIKLGLVGGQLVLLDETGYTTTNEEGKYVLRGIARPGDAQPLWIPHISLAFGANVPYFHESLKLKNPSSFDSLAIDINCQPAKIISGKLLDSQSGKPIKGSVMYYPMLDNKNALNFNRFDASIKSLNQKDKASTDEEGNFQIKVIDGRGVLAARAENSSIYECGRGCEALKIPLEDTFENQQVYLMPGGSYFNTVHLIAVNDSSASQVVDIKLSTLKSTLINVKMPNGSPAVDFQARGRFRDNPVSHNKSESLSNQVSVYGLDDGNDRQLQIWKGSLGAVVTINLATTAPIVLKPCGTIRGKIASSDTWENTHSTVEAYVTKNVIEPRNLFDHQYDRVATARPGTDATFELNNILPDAPCMIRMTTNGKIKEITINQKIEPGQIIDLGDVNLDKPNETFDVTDQNSTQAKVSAEPAQTISGSVSNADGKSVVDAKVYLINTQIDRPSWTATHEVITEMKTDDSGEFKFRLPVDLLNQIGDRQTHLKSLMILAVKDGQTPQWETIASNRKTLPNAVHLQFPESKPIQGRLVDEEGNPVVNATVRIAKVVQSTSASDVAQWIAKAKNNPLKVDATMSNDSPKTHFFPSNAFLNNNGLPAFTQTGTTDKDGRFTLDQLGKNLHYVLEILGDGIAKSRINVVTSDFESVPYPSSDPRFATNQCFGSKFEMVAPSEQKITGFLLELSSGDPIAGASIEVESFGPQRLSITNFSSAITAEDGSYTLTGVPRVPAGVPPIELSLTPPKGKAFFGATNLSVPVGNDLKPIKFDIRLKKTKLISGQLIDQATGNGVKGYMSYFPFIDNEAAKKYSNFKAGVRNMYPETYETDDQGNFAVPVIAGKGIVTGTARFPVRFETGICDQENILNEFKTMPISDLGEQKVYHLFTGQMINTAKVIDVGNAMPHAPIKVELVAKAKTTFHFVDSDGQPLNRVKTAGVFAPAFLAIDERLSGAPESQTSSVELFGTEPRLLLCRHEKMKLGAAQKISPEDFGNSDQKIILEPCAKVTGRVDPTKLQSQKAKASLVVDGKSRPANGITSRAPIYVTFDMIKPDGTFEIDGVLPGWNYEIQIDRQSFEIKSGTKIKPGETIDMGMLSLK